MRYSRVVKTDEYEPAARVAMACNVITCKVSAQVALCHRRPIAFTIRWLAGDNIDVADHYVVSRSTCYRLVYECVDLIIDAFPISFPATRVQLWTLSLHTLCPNPFFKVWWAQLTGFSSKFGAPVQANTTVQRITGTSFLVYVHHSLFTNAHACSQCLTKN
jgi:hypothetical protein